LQIKNLSPTINIMKETKSPKVEESWDKKKIAIALLILFGLISGAVYISGAYKIKGKTANDPLSTIKKSVRGATTDINSQGIKKAVQQKIDEIKTEASSIDIVEIASSSPQVQKIISDLKSLENYPADQAKSMCEKICNSF
jgi:hypothetical protein